MAIINIVEETAGGVEVWIDVPGADLGGIIIGLGESRAEALADAVRCLEALTEQLQSPPEVWETDPTAWTLAGQRHREFTIATHKYAEDV